MGTNEGTARTRVARDMAVGLLLCSSLACSSESASGKAADGIAIPPECRGFEMQGIRYSPGGSVLPDTCKPFDPNTNNPYAVRCIDVLPGYQTRYPGDDACILPPPPDKGAQVGVHPQREDYWERMWAGDYSGYSDDSLTAEFEVAPGDEIEQSYTSSLGNTETVAWYRIASRMRPGSHHLATYKSSSPATEQWTSFDGATPPEGDGGFLWNTQNAFTNRPPSILEVPAEDRGLGSTVDENQTVSIDVHHFNGADVPILREVWINLWWVEGGVTQPVGELPLVAPVSCPPNQITILEGSHTATESTRVLSAFAHRHAWTRRLNAWVRRTDGTETPVYDSFDYHEVPMYAYDTVTQNPVADPAIQRDGGYTGILTLAPGDQLLFNCHVDTTAERSAELGVPVPTETLVFGNKALGAEMCILYAQIVTPP